MAPGGDAYKVVPTVAGNGRFDLGRADMAGMNQDQMTDQNKKALAAAGGVKGVAAKLKVNLETGLMVSVGSGGGGGEGAGGPPLESQSRAHE